MKIFFYGGRNAGVFALLTLIAAKHKIIGVVAQDKLVKDLAESYDIPVFKDLKYENIVRDRGCSQIRPDLIVCCHGRKRLTTDILNAAPCINLHPCLYKYKGAAPIKRMLEDKVTKASVACHHMTETIDGGDVIVEVMQEVKGKTEVEIYNELYPLYGHVLLEALKKL